MAEVPGTTPNREVDDRGGVYDHSTWKFDPRTGKPLDGTEPEPENVVPQKDGETPSGDFTHYVHLHDGRVIKHDMALFAHRIIGDRYTEGEIGDDGTDNRTISQVIGVYAK